MISAIGFAPQPPLLVPEVASGAASELDELRGWCDQMLNQILDGADELLIFGSAPGIQLGRWLAQRVQWPGPVSELRPGGPAEALEALRLAEASPTTTALLVMGDGAACRTEKAPGYLDERSFDFDDRIAAALAEVDVDALTSIDQQTADELLVAGRNVWPTVAALVDGDEQTWTGELLYRADPYGVSYFVAQWRRD